MPLPPHTNSERKRERFKNYVILKGVNIQLFNKSGQKNQIDNKLDEL